MTNVCHSLYAAVLTALLSLGAPQQAQAGAFIPDLLLPTPDQSGFVAIPSTRTPGPWGADFGLWTGYRHEETATPADQLNDDLVARGYQPIGKLGPSTAHILESTFTAQLGLGSRGALALRLPVTWMQMLSSTATGLGNPALEGRVRVYGAPVRPDGSARDGAAVALRGVVHAPMPTDGAFLADDKTRAELDAIIDLEAFGLGAAAMLAYRHRFESDPFAAASLDQSLRLTLGLRVPLPLLSAAYPGKVAESAVLELSAGTSPAAPFEKTTTPAEILLGYRLGLADFWLSLCGGTSLATQAAAPDARAVLGLAYSPRVHDQDADGVPDRADQCEHLAEDHDQFEDGDGCPEPDNDQDMILDEDDRCPQVAAEIDRDQDEDGCTDP